MRDINIKNLRFFYFVFVIFLFGCEQGELSDYSGLYDFSIMSFNIRFDTEEDGTNKWSNRKEACVEMIQEVQPTVFGIQEGLYNQVHYLDENLPNYQYFGVGRDDGYSSGEYAAVFYSTNHFELIEGNSFWLSETPEYPSLGWDANNIRIVSWVKLKDLNTDNVLYVFNTHFDHKGKTAQLESSKLLVNRIEDIVTESSAPVLITGDFNMLVGNSRMAPIIEQYFSARRFALRSDNIPSFNAWGREILNRNIDFVFYQNATALSFKTIVKSYEVPYISDHYPIISHFEYQ